MIENNQEIIILFVVQKLIHNIISIAWLGCTICRAFHLFLLEITISKPVFTMYLQIMKHIWHPMPIKYH